MILPSLPAGLPAPPRLQERCSQLVVGSPGAPAVGSTSKSALAPLQRSAVIASVAAPDTEAQPSATATAQLDTGFRLHPDALNRRQRAEKR